MVPRSCDSAVTTDLVTALGNVTAKHAKYTKRNPPHRRERFGRQIQQEVTEKTEARVYLCCLRWLLFKPPNVRSPQKVEHGTRKVE
ncbi:MAG: hypothetical protein DME22_01565 [Verrucomicrobia bacterium]|nr:MAG: hypothetical protein DME22_01565 [Verrucomicrobiota bacterium]PYK01695.1 MAG: hypothetical protein DME23_03550 [Verrucomicrobiota bacterium]